MKEGEKEEEVDVNIEILRKILDNILNDSHKQKVEDSIDCRNCKVHVSAHSRYHDAAETTFKEDLRDVCQDLQLQRKVATCGITCD